MTQKEIVVYIGGYMTELEKSTLMFSLNNNTNCCIKEHSISKRVIFIQNGKLSNNKEVLILLNDIYFSSEMDYEVYGHIVKYTKSSWCSCLVLSHVNIDKKLSQYGFIRKYNQEVINNGHWSPMNSMSKNDVFIEVDSYKEAIEAMNVIIRNYSNKRNIPLPPSPEEEMLGIEKVQDGNCDFRLLNLYSIKSTCS